VVDKIPEVDDKEPIEEPVIEDIEITEVGVDGVDGLENPAPQIVEINDLHMPEADPIKIETVQEETVEVETVQEETAVEEQEPELRRSTQARFEREPAYIPSMDGATRYDYAVTQLEDGVLTPDAHMFAQGGLYQAEPEVVAAIMMQLSMMAGFKEWGDKAYEATQSEMKQLHLRDTFKPKHLNKVTQGQRSTILESHMFLKETQDS
jgi:hypothetical protein